MTESCQSAHEFDECPVCHVCGDDLYDFSAFGMCDYCFLDTDDFIS